MFLGTFTPKLLTGSQIVLPAKIRSALGSDRAVITTGFEKCVFGFSTLDWKSISDLELTKPLSTLEGRKIRRQMFAAAIEIDFDEQGRFVMPEYLRQYAGVKSELVIIGAGDHFEIWDKKLWEKEQKNLGNK